jgi:hypothetical protein
MEDTSMGCRRNGQARTVIAPATQKNRLRPLSLIKAGLYNPATIGQFFSIRTLPGTLFHQKSLPGTLTLDRDGANLKARYRNWQLSPTRRFAAQSVAPTSWSAVAWTSRSTPNSTKVEITL